jgi:hypothetical protein
MKKQKFKPTPAATHRCLQLAGSLARTVAALAAPLVCVRFTVQAFSVSSAPDDLAEAFMSRTKAGKAKRKVSMTLGSPQL